MTLEAVSIDVQAETWVLVGTLHRIDDCISSLRGGRQESQARWSLVRGRVRSYSEATVRETGSRALRCNAILSDRLDDQTITCTPVMMLFEGSFPARRSIATPAEFARTKRAAEVATVSSVGSEADSRFGLLMHTSGLTYAWPAYFRSGHTPVRAREIGATGTTHWQTVGSVSSVALVHQRVRRHSHRLGRLVEALRPLTFDNFLLTALRAVEMPDSEFMFQRNVSIGCNGLRPGATVASARQRADSSVKPRSSQMAGVGWYRRNRLRTFCPMLAQMVCCGQRAHPWP